MILQILHVRADRELALETAFSDLSSRNFVFSFPLPSNRDRVLPETSSVRWSTRSYARILEVPRRRTVYALPSGRESG